MATHKVQRLPWCEQAFYWIVEIFTLCYMLYNLYIASENAWRTNEPINLSKGWTLIGRPRDSNDYEWTFWSSYIWKLLPCIACHIALACLCSSLSICLKTRQVVLTLFAMLAVCSLMGTLTMLTLCLHPVLCYLVSYLRNSLLVWAVTVSFIGALNFYPEEIMSFVRNLRKIERMENVEDFAVFYMFVFVWANMCQRSTAFALECVWVNQKKTTFKTREQKQPGAVSGSGSEQDSSDSGYIARTSGALSWTTLSELPGWLDLFFYVFYLPLFFTGPFIVYSNFHKQMRVPVAFTTRRVLDIVLKVLRIGMWAVIICFVLHFIYPYAIKDSEKTLVNQSRWTVAAIGWVLGQLFMMKYVVIFGIPAQVARLEGFEPPAVPACISYIYCYGDMWKSFDRGLYDFLKRYIFIPAGGSRAGLLRQLSGSALCFAYIFHWHGGDFYLLLWCIVNYIETSLEHVGVWFESSSFVRRHFYDRLSEVGKRRFRAFLSMPLLIMSVFAIFYFFSRLAGNIFLIKLLVDIPWSYFAIFMFLVYCAIQNAMEVERLGITKHRMSAKLEKD